jgi:septum formation protein
VSEFFTGVRRDPDFLVYLASQSPRRRTLLEQIGVPCRVMPVDIPELPQPGEAPALYVERLALEKARTCRERLAASGESDDGLRSATILGADTSVVVDNEVLGKPRDRADGLAMLRRLSGRDHEVLTGVAVIRGAAVHCALSVSRVRFAPLSDAAIAAYWDTGEPADKAGAYAVQGFGAAFIERIEGSYSGVMGLPLFEVANLLARVHQESL